MASPSPIAGLLPAWRPPMLLLRADWLLARRAAVNAALAIDEERVRRRQWQQEADLVLLELLPRPRRAAS